MYMTGDLSQTAVSDSFKNVSNIFEQSFFSVPLEIQISLCDRYELATLFKHRLPANQPILEAGCGSGRWVAWCLNNGWQAAGLDWSEALCARAREGIPRAKFVSGDMRAMPFLNGEFGAILALGSIEHVPEGPETVLKEFNRILRQNGIAIITVPFNGPVRKMSRFVRFPMQWAKASRWLRRILKKKGHNGQSLKDAKKETLLEYASDFICNNRGWTFYQYQFTKEQMRTLMNRCGFQIIEEFIEFGDEGIFHNIGRIVGTFDHIKGVVVFSLIGKVLRKLFPIHLTGHMLCYVVRRV